MYYCASYLPTRQKFLVENPMGNVLTDVLILSGDPFLLCHSLFTADARKALIVCMAFDASLMSPCSSANCLRDVYWSGSTSRNSSAVTSSTSELPFGMETLKWGLLRKQQGQMTKPAPLLTACPSADKIVVGKDRHHESSLDMGVECLDIQASLTNIRQSPTCMNSNHNIFVRLNIHLCGIHGIESNIL